jgi:hypothetical protein
MLLALIALLESVRVAREAMLVTTVRLGTRVVAAARNSRTQISRTRIWVIAVGAMLELQAWSLSLAAGSMVMVRAPTPRRGRAWRRG